VTSNRVEVAVFAIALTVFGLVALALIWSSDWAYAGFAQATGNTRTTFVRPAGGLDPAGEIPLTLDDLRDWHSRWTSYVIGLTDQPPNAGPGGPLFTPDEYAHMADVRTVFRGAEVAAVLALFVGAYRISRARRRGEALRLVRAGALVAAGIVAIIGLAAVVAFDPLFLLFHDVFFPQGNFLFDPATSNLLRLYPEWYWQGITAGVGVSFIAVALLVAAAAHIALRRRSNTYTRAA
jgi:integral membrane protein (TIGR01906 family)